ncbi:penicillin-binding protein 1C [Novosphingobium sp.]|uniref:penicillin-binding protein 1C n=1 Tax=Novosphingobium sp. TaxID=1874826 RepID=UPI0025D06EDB|nr:penicillin-binding protein 1C [Novosphingobium sp.]MCC6926855.1 penicillin-binding protein 1C [Novosphingobium sp.]
MLWWWTAPPTVPAYADLKRSWKSSEAWLHARDGSLLSEVRVDFAQRRLAWVPLGEIAPALGQDVIGLEDHRFLKHGGVDWLALGGSIRDAVQGKRARGASTLTMQTAAFLWPDIGRPGARGWFDKLRQMRTAWAIEASWNKNQILEAYLNLAPFRGENQGVGAGSLALFGKRPAALDPREAAVMAALLRNPVARPDQVGQRACRLMQPADCPALQVLAEAVAGTGSLKAIDPGLAPHLAARLLTEPGMKVTTTIDPAVQRLAASALQHQLQGLGASRARDGAVVVLDNASGEVLAYVGGVGLGSTAASVDGASAPRQAGSTLKPHLYAQLIERKWLTAASILEDSPVQLDTASGLYVPRNYDNAFMGPVSVRRALANSLNVPAVRALLLDGVQDFRDRLADLGYAGLEADGAYYGFSLALGSAEVTLLEQANSYRTLANLGRWSPFRIRSDDPAGEPRQVLDPGAAWITGDMLSDASARASTFGVDSALRLPFWAAAKTGTSKAMRDNWCIGYSDRFTVAVWVGNLEGDPMRAVSGTSGAAPVWRDVMIGLHQGKPGQQPARPANVVAAPVNFATGREPPRSEWFLEGTAQQTMAQAPAFARRPRITNPVSGAVYARDPDIPGDRQSIGIAISGDSGDLRLTLDGRPLPADQSARQVPLIPGSHLLTLLDASGKMVDQVRFTVR